VKWAALSSALTVKLNDEEVVIIDEIAVNAPKTKEVRGLLKGLNLERDVLIIVPAKNEPLELAVRNLPGVRVSRVSELNVYSVLSHEKLLITREAVEKMKEVYLG
jgi:large subunit ribosomal protein L4